MQSMKLNLFYKIKLQHKLYKWFSIKGLIDDYYA